MSQSSPRVTVLMPAHNAARYVAEAIQSVLDQTFADFELLVIDDGSTDTTTDVVSRFTDPRIRLVSNDRNMGIAGTLNRGFELARGEYIARMDADDLCRPARLEGQVRFMDLHRDVVLVGTWFATFGNGFRRVVKPPCSDPELRAWLLAECPFGHPTVMLRRSVLQQHGISYDANFSRVEDYELWSRLAGYGQIANIPQVLVEYREHPAQVSSRFSAVQTVQANLVRRRLLADIMPNASQTDIELHLRAISGWHSTDSIAAVELWLARVLSANLQCGKYEAAALASVVGTLWYRFLSRRTDRSLIRYALSTLEPSALRRLYRLARLTAKSLLRKNDPV